MASRTGALKAGLLTGLPETLLKLIFPPRCLLCRAVLAPGTERPLCSRCRPRFIPGGIVCPQCGLVARRVKSCSCAEGATPLQGLFALSWYEGEWRQMLLRLKFAGRRQLARPLGHWLGRELAAEPAWPVAAVVPLPMYRQKEALRGYNQAELIARAAAHELGLPLVRLLKKTRHTASQTGLSLQERKRNVTGAFAVCRPLPPGRAVLLVDDIYSTGATMGEAALALQRSGLVVYGAVAAYNPRLH